MAQLIKVAKSFIRKLQNGEKKKKEIDIKTVLLLQHGVDRDGGAGGEVDGTFLARPAGGAGTRASGLFLLFPLPLPPLQPHPRL